MRVEHGIAEDKAMCPQCGYNFIKGFDKVRWDYDYDAYVHIDCERSERERKDREYHAVMLIAKKPTPGTSQGVLPCRCDRCRKVLNPHPLGHDQRWMWKEREELQ